MGIQPIDLQTMYSQMTNVSSRYASDQQAVVNSIAAFQNLSEQQKLEESKTVQKAASNQSQTGGVKEDGKNETYQNNSKSREKDNSNENQKKDNIIREDYLGTLIDIVR